MSNLTAESVNADIAFLTDSFQSGHRHIPSFSNILKKSATIPLISLVLSLISTITTYFFTSYSATSVAGYIEFLFNEGWVIVGATAVVGLIFTLLMYNNFLTYMAVPNEIRGKSLVINHLKSVARRTVIFFLFLMVVSSLLAALTPWFAGAIPLLLFIMMFVVNLVVGAEINRLGAGLALEKISKLINKI